MDRNSIIKGAVAAMDSMAKINNEKNKLKMNMLMNNERVQNNFLMQMELAKQKQQLDQQSPEGQMKQEMFNQYKANPSGFDILGGSPKPLGLKDMAERVYMKPEEQWDENDKRIIASYNKYNTQTITDASGKSVGTRPKGSVFQPKGEEIPSWVTGGKATTQPTAQPIIQPQTGRIRVKTKDGQTGTIDAGEFDPNNYEKI